MNYEALGQRIRNERIARKWTQARLAKEVQLSISFLGHVERGSRKASLETVVSLANVLHVSADFLLADSLIEQQKPGMYDQLNTRQRRVLREIIQQMSKDLDEWVDE